MHAVESNFPIHKHEEAKIRSLHNENYSEHGIIHATHDCLILDIMTYLSKLGHVLKIWSFWLLHFMGRFVDELLGHLKLMGDVWVLRDDLHVVVLKYDEKKSKHLIPNVKSI